MAGVISEKHCNGLKPYASKSQAIRMTVRKLGRESTILLMRTYRCKECRNWHITEKEKKYEDNSGISVIRGGTKKPV